MGWKFATNVITLLVLIRPTFFLVQGMTMYETEQKRRNIVLTGEEQPCAKLTKKSVKDARWEHAIHGVSFQALADKYGVSKKTMQNAIKGVTWKCVQYMPEAPKEDAK